MILRIRKINAIRLLLNAIHLSSETLLLSVMFHNQHGWLSVFKANLLVTTGACHFNKNITDIY